MSYKRKWSPEEDSMLRNRLGTYRRGATVPDAALAVAREIGRSLGAVYTRWITLAPEPSPEPPSEPTFDHRADLRAVVQTLDAYARKLSELFDALSDSLSEHDLELSLGSPCIAETPEHGGFDESEP